ncbi:MAG: hypothetical protein LBL73_07970, partial [Synergistaceae bacterium]|nr:hypothetical protein [Synergistaceae bacterium]
MTTAAAGSAANAKKVLRLGAVLFTVTAVTGLILGAVNEITREPIRRTQARLRAEALAGALPGADEFLPVGVADGADPMVRGVDEGRRGGS